MMRSSAARSGSRYGWSDDEEGKLEAGLSEIARFLSQRPPFDALAPEELAEVAAQAAIEFHARGTVILSECGGLVTFLRVVHSGGVDVLHGGRLLDLLRPGDMFGHAAMLTGLPPGFEARAAEDTLCYRIPVEEARPLLERARRRELEVGGTDAAYRPVGALIRSATVTCRPEESIGAVAERMTAAGASAAVVQLPDDDRGGESGIGIITDRDLRTRVLAAGCSGADPVEVAMTAPAYAVGPERLGGEVLYEMLGRGIRHVPVIADHGRLVGVLQAADLYAAQPMLWFGARRAIERAQGLDALLTVAGRLLELLRDLHHSSVPALELAPVLSALQDALTHRALELVCAQTQITPPGGVWVSIGAQARRELTPGSPRRGALVRPVGAPPPGAWLATAMPVLERCGIRGTIEVRDGDDWRRLAQAGDETALGVVADRRVLWGTPHEPLPSVRDASEREAVLRRLAERALAYPLPTGFDADAVLTPDGRHPRLNVRETIVLPIATIGCWVAAAADSGALSTPGRLRAAADGGVLRSDQAQTLTEAFELALEMQIVHQLKQIEVGQAPDDLLDASAMSRLTRGRLRDVFHAVSTVVRELAQ